MESEATRVLATVASGMAGLVIGSFLNVVVHRVPRGMSIARPPSHCPVCDARLGALENIPVVSWVGLRGRCGHCGTPIPVRYPAVELATGVLFVGLALALPSPPPLSPLDALVAVTVAIAAIDLDGMPVPFVLEVVALAFAATLVAVSLAGDSTGRLGWAAIGAAVGVLGWAATWLARRGSAVRTSPGPAAALAWGWGAGWMALGGGLAVGAFLALWALVATGAGRRVRPAAGAAIVAVTAIMAGAIAAR